MFRIRIVLNAFVCSLLTNILHSKPLNTIQSSDTKYEQGNFFQGDIYLVPEQHDIFKFEPSAVDEKKVMTGLIETKYRWPKDHNGHVIVPYKISKTSNYS